jgi:lipopolysaccharide biosynthesis glycosyltransferase
MSYSSSLPIQLLVSGFDDAYVWPWIVQVFSGEKSREREVHRAIAVTPDSLSAESKAVILEVAEWLKISINFIDLELPADLPVSHHFTEMTYARIVLADILESTFIWLDADILLGPGWDQLLALPEPAGGFVSRAALADGNQQRMAGSLNQAVLRAGNSYFSAGVMQINPVAWRQKGLNHQWKQLLEEYESRGFEWVDQCALNFFLFESNMVLPAGFNFSPYSGDANTAGPHIVHYTGSNKPWMVAPLERNRFMSRLVGHPHNRWVLKWWDTEKELLAAAGANSKELGEKLRMLQVAQRLPHDFSIYRAVRILRRLSGLIRWKTS